MVDKGFHKIKLQITTEHEEERSASEFNMHTYNHFLIYWH